MKRVFTWLNNSLEEFLMGAGLIMMTAIMGIQVVFRYAFGMSLSWSEEITRYIFYLGRIFEHQLLYEKMYFYKSGAVCGDVSETRKSVV